MRDPPAPGYDANSGAAAQLRAVDVSSWGAEFWKNTRAGVRQHRLRWGRQALSENLKQVPTPSLALAFLTLAETFSQLPSLLKLFQKQAFLNTPHLRPSPAMAKCSTTLFNNSKRSTTALRVCLTDEIDLSGRGKYRGDAWWQSRPGTW